MSEMVTCDFCQEKVYLRHCIKIIHPLRKFLKNEMVDAGEACSYKCMKCREKLARDYEELHERADSNEEKLYEDIRTGYSLFKAIRSALRSPGIKAVTVTMNEKGEFEADIVIVGADEN